MRFTTGKDPVITDLGALSDDASNGTYSIHSRKGFGGDMIADASGNLYVLTANRHVFKVSIENKVATYLGMIKGLPDGFSTNGAMVEEGSKVIVASSESAIGYFRFDLTTMQAEKVSTTASVFNASDLANERLAFAKKKKDKKNAEEPKQQQPVTEEVTKKSPLQNSFENNGIDIYPNPATSGFVKVSFSNQPVGRYSLDLLDVTGKLIQTKEVNIRNNMQIEEVRIPKTLSAGSNLLKITGVTNSVSFTNKIVVQQ